MDSLKKQTRRELIFLSAPGILGVLGGFTLGGCRNRSSKRGLSLPPPDPLHTPALFKSYPELLGKIPYLPLAELKPTPIHPLKRFALATGIENLWIKRDDLLHPLCGGIKLRVAEFLLADALDQGATRIVALGVLGSSLIAQLAYFGSKRNLPLEAIYLPQKPLWDVMRIFLFAGRYVKKLEIVEGRVSGFLRFLGRVWQRGEGTYPLYPQGVGRRGAWGYISAGMELGEQMKKGEIPQFARLFLPVFSGMAAYGIAAGLRLSGVKLPITGVLVTPRPWLTPARMKVQEALAELRALAPSIPPFDLETLPLRFEERFAGKGFGIPTDATRHAKVNLDLSEEIFLDLSYGAKALACAMDALEKEPGNPMLLWATSPPTPPESELISLETLGEEVVKMIRELAASP